MGQPDLLQAARAWSAAAAYADADPEAADAVRTCEQRLRVLHPYAMARYDRLRGEGTARLDAMREALPLFARAPRARPGDPVAERRGPAAPDGRGTASCDIGVDDSGVAQAADSSAIRQAEQRGRQIVRELQARALAERGYALGPDELVTTLGATTTLPGDLIARLAPADSQDRVAWGAERARADDLGSASAASVPRWHGARRVPHRGCAAPADSGHRSSPCRWRPQRDAAGSRELPVHRHRRGHRGGHRRNPGSTIRRPGGHGRAYPPARPFGMRL
jgi:hypothetical protein